MSVKHVGMDASHVSAKRAQLLKLRRELEHLANAAEVEEVQVRG